MSVWLCIPSKRPPEEANPVLNLWRERGYKIALCRDEGENSVACDLSESILPYPGYAAATNLLIEEVLKRDPLCYWMVIGGDDVEPDLSRQQWEISAECLEHFQGTFGVMQPTGDRWGEENGSAYSDRVCGSAWIGRDFALRVNGGRGPLWPEYRHMYADEELQCVAQKYGVLWQRRDLIQIHRHWARERADVADMPEFLREANSQEHWKQYGDLFRQRKAAGFPGSELAE